MSIYDLLMITAFTDAALTQNTSPLHLLLHASFFPCLGSQSLNSYDRSCFYVNCFSNPMIVGDNSFNLYNLAHTVYLVFLCKYCFLCSLFGSSDDLFYCFMCIVWSVGFKKKKGKRPSQRRKTQLDFEAKLIQALNLSSGRRLFRGCIHHEKVSHPFSSCSQRSRKRRICIFNVPFYLEEPRASS
ncbi:hypothetical protein EDC96DRAFT_550156 [Choanephora cucurbitarum]|nr:hypothetical protein EDC96DRAFT_550156 [Choanephora cucurbitarum]